MVCALALCAASASSSRSVIRTGSTNSRASSGAKSAAGSAPRMASTSLAARGIESLTPLRTRSATKPRGETLTPPHSSSTRSEADVVPSSSVSVSSLEAERERDDRDRARRGVAGARERVDVDTVAARLAAREATATWLDIFRALREGVARRRRCIVFIWPARDAKTRRRSRIKCFVRRYESRTADIPCLAPEACRATRERLGSCRRSARLHGSSCSRSEPYFRPQTANYSNAV